MKYYYNDPKLGVVGVDPGPTSGEFTYLTGMAPRYTWYQADAVEDANALCQAIRERNALRAQVERWSNELADALGCVNEHSGARQQPYFAEMVEMVWRLRTERDDLMGERELLRCRVAETETEVTRDRNAQLSTLRDRFAMAYMQSGRTPAQAFTLADEALKERSK